MSALLPQSSGWYGKLPARGDFVGRGLPRGWVRTWDAWLQRSMLAASQQLGAAALRERLSLMAPWQCLVLPQRAGDLAWCGVLVASADRVGRVFPLLWAESFESVALGSVDLGGLSARARGLVEWLEQAKAQLTPRELEAGAAPWANAALACPEPDDTRPGTDVDGLRSSTPGAASFWWPVGASAAALAARCEPWPPTDALLLHLLGMAPAGAAPSA
jgi:type VI secretion system protein ImpM